VRWTCTLPLIAWVLDELEASTTPADYEVSQGRAIVDYVLYRVQRIERRGRNKSSVSNVPTCSDRITPLQYVPRTPPQAVYQHL
jgi:hypothetical protein